MSDQDIKKFSFHILVIDDDQRLRLLLKQFLEKNGFRVSDAEDTYQAKKIMKSLIFDLLVIDIMMPGQNGLEFLKEVRLKNNVPALMLSAMSAIEDRLDGLEFGADDYMTKPFEPRELLLRIQNILKRFTPNISRNNENTRFGPFLFNQNSLNLYKDGISVHLTTSEQKLLNCFALSPNKALSRDDINNLLGGNMEIRSIDVAIVRIRRKLEQDQRYPIYLQTVRGVGWMLQTHEDKINYD
ncbi:response regulator transcription factor [Alphaproteobacteria bacterium]|jgi:two-component system phosphate regulon response regulator OmpR|nr:response regulator transcription factor [Alphaproteobacteria bacterium]